MLLTKLGMWFDSHYDKIWVVITILVIVCFVMGFLCHNENIIGTGEDLTDFYDEVLS